MDAPRATERPATARVARLAGAVACLLALIACADPAPPPDRLEVAARGAWAIALSADGAQAAVGSVDHGGSLWDLRAGERRFDWNHRAAEASALAALAFSPEGTHAISAEGATLVLWDTAQGHAISWFEAPAPVLALALGPGGRLALLGLEDGRAVLLDLRDGHVARELRHDGPVRAVALDREARLALTGSADRSARLWRAGDGTLLQRWELAAEAALVVLSPDGARAFTAGPYERPVIWDTATGLARAEIPASAPRIARGERITAARFRDDGTALLAGTSDGRVLLWSGAPATLRGEWKLPRREGLAGRSRGARVLAVAFDGESVLGASADGIIQRWWPRAPR